MKNRVLLALLAAVLALGVVPHRVCERDADAAFEGDPAYVEPLARGVLEELRHPVSTGSARFDAEWRLASAVTAAIGFAQIGRPAEMEPLVETALAETGFDREAWGGEDALAGDRGHMGWLGWIALPLALHRSLVPGSRFAGREEAIARALDRRFARGLVETYPGETYPADNAMGLAALAVHARTTRASSPGLAAGLAALRAQIDPATGLLRQSVGGPARGSGTALTACVIAYADEALARSLYESLRRESFRTVLGFGGVLEGSGADIDSGPVILGFGVSATGFALGASRAMGDRETFRALYASAHLFGAPVHPGGARTFATGSSIGNAILFAMITSPRRATS